MPQASWVPKLGIHSCRQSCCCHWHRKTCKASVALRHNRFGASSQRVVSSGKARDLKNLLLLVRHHRTAVAEFEESCTLEAKPKLIAVQASPALAASRLRRLTQNHSKRRPASEEPRGIGVSKHLQSSWPERWARWLARSWSPARRQAEQLLRQQAL